MKVSVRISTVFLGELSEGNPWGMLEIVSNFWFQDESVEALPQKHPGGIS